MKTLVPPAPVGAIGEEKPKIGEGRSKVKSPFDAAFLRRVYRSMLIFGVPMTLLAAYGFQTAAGAGSFVGGMLLAALMLRLQEVSIRSMLRPTSQTGGFDTKLLLLLLLPLKFLAVGVVLWIVNSMGFLKLAPFALGFFAAQLVLLCQVAGWLVSRSMAVK
ncbi:hypothetical protein IAD21_00964 [Abditibacteriota bacterium]|nr:hypothetical protein IAD21_00964 [Abditibacteriota bacterium]